MTMPQASETGKVILPSLKPTYSDEFIFGYSRPFLNVWSVELWGQYRTVHNVIEDYPTVNRLTSPSSFVYGNLDGDLEDVNGKIVATGVTAKREYTAASVEIKKQWSDNWSLTAMYTWSKLYGNWDLDYSPGTSLFYASSYIEDAPGLYIEDPLRTGLMSGNRTHVFKLFGAWEFYKHLTFGGFLRLQTGRPWEARIRDYYGNYYAYVEKAGSQTLPTWTNFDLQLSYAIPLGGRFQGIVEARFMNVFDAQTIMSVDMRSDLSTFTQCHILRAAAEVCPDFLRKLLRVPSAARRSGVGPRIFLPARASGGEDSRFIQGAFPFRLADRKKETFRVLLTNGIGFGDIDLFRISGLSSQIS